MASATQNARLITGEYLRLQRELHTNPNYGVASRAFAEQVDSLISSLGVKTLCDYGAGKQVLKQSLRAPLEAYHPYDPAFPEYGGAKPADLVCCIDVLEHIEPELLANVLDDLRRLVVKFGFFTIHTGPAAKLLSDGRNAHLIQKPLAWWQQKLESRFKIISIQNIGVNIWVVVAPLPTAPVSGQNTA